MKLILVFIILVLFSVRRVLHSSIAALLSINVLIGASITTCKKIYNSNITSSAFTSLSQDDLETSLSLRQKLNTAAQNKFNLLLQLPVDITATTSWYQSK
jgi:hypothetical protein